MTERSDGGHGLGPEEQDLGSQLAEQRPVPSASFRGALGRRLSRRDPGYGPRPETLRLVVAGYAGAGALVIGLGTLVATGVL
jgi:hypothetical protein